MGHTLCRKGHFAHLMVVAFAVVTYGIAGCTAQAISAADQQLFDFGRVVLGSSSGTQTITLANFGDPATIVSVAIKVKAGSPENPFFITGGNCTSATLQTLDTCTVLVQVIPNIAGALQGLVTVTATNLIDGTFTSQPVTVTATAIAPQLTMSPPLDFGNVQVGTMSPPQTILLINTGTVPAITGGAVTMVFAIGGATPQFKATGGTCFRGPVLKPGESCTFIIAATPTMAGPAHQFFSLQGPGGSGYGQILDPLTVNGVSPTLPASPSPSPAPTPSPMVSTATTTNPLPSPTTPIPPRSPDPSPSPSPSPSSRHHRHHLGR